ncbi:DUF924 family protein [Roseateles sp.]|uniref:DUF924 family protein n=1 Tax=Roseateles sp. TaxID=1971397 RepID=UPI003D0C2982
MSTLDIQHHSESGAGGAIQGRFWALVDGHQIELDYQLSGRDLVFTHTGTAPALQGRGLAGKLVAHGLRWAAGLGLPLLPGCSYVEAYLQRHPQWQRLRLPADAQAVLNYWFGTLGSAEDGQVRPLWFTKSAATDAEIRSRFGALVEQALQQGLSDWGDSAQARLARILLLDQFTRNIFRDSARAFAGDPLALQLALSLMDQPEARELSALQRWFMLMPLEHAEDLTLQNRCVRAFEALAAEDPRLAGAADYAHRHQQVIAQYGRFPHRNALLGRASTEAEQQYLAQPGAGF